MCAKTVSLVSSKKLLSVHPCVSVMQPQVVLAPTCHHPLVRSESKYASVSLHVYLLSVLSVFLSTRHVWFISLLVLIKKSPVSSVQIDLHHKSLFHFLPLVFVHSKQFRLRCRVSASRAHWLTHVAPAERCSWGLGVHPQPLPFPDANLLQFQASCSSQVRLRECGDWWPMHACMCTGHRCVCVCARPAGTPPSGLGCVFLCRVKVWKGTHIIRKESYIFTTWYPRSCAISWQTLLEAQVSYMKRSFKVTDSQS